MNTENNRLIREFLGTDEITASIPFTYYLGEELPTSGNICTLDSVEDEIRLEIEEGIINEVDVSIEILEYHNDWNELMKVVEKIEELGVNFWIVKNKVKLTIVGELSKKLTYAYYDTEFEGYDFDYFKGENKIEAVYTACIEFIQWYNKQQKQ